MLLLSNRCRGAVTRIYDSVVGEGEESFSYAFDERPVVSAREVGASDASLEKGVTDYHEAVGLVVEGHAAGGMPGYAYHFEFSIADLYDLAVGEI